MADLHRPAPPSLPMPLAFRPRDRMADPRADDRVRQELLTHLAYLREDVQRGFAGIHTRLDTQNGRINGLEKRESAHHERLGALESATTEARLNGDPPHQSRKRTSITLGLGAGGGALLVKLLDMASKALGG